MAQGGHADQLQALNDGELVVEYHTLNFLDRGNAGHSTKALAVPGVLKVVEIPGFTGAPVFLPLGGVAVVARNTWAASPTASPSTASATCGARW